MLKLSRRVDWILEYVISYLLAVIIVLVFTEVLLRIFQYSLIWSEELSRYTFIWLIFLATALAIGRKAHLTMNMILEKIHGKGKLILELGGSIAVTCFFFILGYYSLQVFEIWTRKTSPVLGLSMMYVFLALPVSTALILFYLLAEIVGKIRPKKL